MACRCTTICRLCPNIRISTSVTFAGDNLVVNIPEGSYDDNTKYCIVIAQKIPNEATINAPVVITIGTGDQQYPLLQRDYTPVLASGLKTRTRYACCCNTTPTSATFRLLSNLVLPSNNNLVSVNGTAPATQNVTEDPSKASG